MSPFSISSAVRNSTTPPPACSAGNPIDRLARICVPKNANT